MGRRIAVFVVSCVLSASVAVGAGIPVFDGSNFAQNELQVVENIKQTLQQIQEYQRQLEQLQEQLRNGVGLEDLMGQFEDLFGYFNSMQQNEFGGNSMLGQLGGYQGGGSGAVGDSNYFSSGGASGGGLNYFHDSSSGGQFAQYNLVYGDPRTFYNMPQDAPRAYTREGSEAQVKANNEWLEALGKHQERIQKEASEDMARLREEIEKAGDAEDGGTNKLLGVTNVLLAKLVEQNLVMQQMAITREMAEVTEFQNSNARRMDIEAQAERLREDDESFQRQKEGLEPLQW